MSVEREQRILELLDEALGRSGREREAFLDEACAEDAPLRQELEALLETEIGDGLLSEPAFSVHADDESIGRQIGGYKLVRLLDRGGMGSVYLAEREDFEQRVALKLIRRGLDADEVLVRRFENERQILARLDHPHISRLLDGGATGDRLPYFVMEYVEGVPIDRYCRGHELTVGERLVLFRKVCSAVQFAHQNLVIHRDLKPGNILITEDGEPKLLDFGIAKLLDQGLAAQTLTTAGQGPMTPRYASPEQIRLESVTTASDVYALGVLLYELLTGLDPYGVDNRRSDEVARAICEREPDRPSTAVRRRAAEPEAGGIRSLRRRLSGDLDSIVLKAMRKEPEGRYSTAEQLSEDLHRHLTGLPVDAQTGSFNYRAGKFVRRHRLGMAVATAFLLLTVGFSIVTTVLWRRAETVSFFLKDLFLAADPDARDTEIEIARRLLQRGPQLVKGGSLEGEPELQLVIADTLGKIFHKLGAYDDSKEMMEEALEIARREHGAVHSKVATRLNNLAVLLFEYEDHVQAEGNFLEVLRMRQTLSQDPSALFKTTSNLAMAILRQGRLVEAEKLCRKVLEDRLNYYEDEAHKNDYDKDAPIKNVAASRHNLAAVYYAQGRFEEADQQLRLALEARRQVHGHSHTKVATSLDLLGSISAARDPEGDAKELLEEALNIRNDRLGQKSLKPFETRKNLALALARSDPKAALRHARKALEVFDRIRPDGWDAAEARSILGMIQAGSGAFSEAEPNLTEGYASMLDLRKGQTYRNQLALQRILDLYRAWNKPNELERYQKMADAL